MVVDDAMATIHQRRSKINILTAMCNIVEQLNAHSERRYAPFASGFGLGLQPAPPENFCIVPLVYAVRIPPHLVFIQKSLVST
jgi:hypothetical protein